MSINKAILIGNVGKDPEVRDINGSKVANFTLATSEKGYTKQDGTQVPERTEWHSIVAWGKLAEVCGNYVRRGTKLFIEGKIRTRNYEKDGQKHYVTEVFADNLEMLSAPQQSQQAPAPAPAPVYAQPQQQPAQTQYQQPWQQAYPQPQYQQAPPPAQTGPMGDPLPF